MEARTHAGTMMGLLQRRCTERLLYVLIFLENAVTSALMIYALLWEAGNLVNLPDKRIGFYNFCLGDGTLQCLQNQDLEAMGISLVAMALARLCVYGCVVFSMFYPIFVCNVKCSGETEGWKMLLTILVIKTVMLLGGLCMILSQTWQWFHPSDISGGFHALIWAQVLLVLQILTTTVFLWRAKRTHRYQNPSTEAPPIELSQ